MDAGSVRRLTWSCGRLPEMNEVRPYLLLTGRDPVVSSSAAMSAWMSVLWNTGVLTLTLTLTPTEHLDPSHSFTKWATLNGKLCELYRPFGAFLHGLIVKVWVHCSYYTIEIYCTLQHFSFKRQGALRDWGVLGNCGWFSRFFFFVFFSYRSLLLSDISETSESIHGRKA